MKRRQFIIFLLLTFLLSQNMLWSKSDLKDNYYKRVSPKEAYEIIKENKDNPEVVILDVRTEKEFKTGYIENAKNIDFYASDFQEQINNLDKNKIYLVYCRSGSRSTQTLDIMKNLGFEKVINIGGMNEWLDAGLPVVE